MNDNMFADIMFAQLQRNMAKMCELILPEKEPPRPKSIRTVKAIHDRVEYAKTKKFSTYGVYDGYNTDVSKLLFHVICAITGERNEWNNDLAIHVIKHFVPEPVEQPKPITPEPIPVKHQRVCKYCNTTRDIRKDFYKNRIKCKKCVVKQIIEKRKQS
jgi:hypothetical protein